MSSSTDAEEIIEVEAEPTAESKRPAFLKRNWRQYGAKCVGIERAK